MKIKFYSLLFVLIVMTNYSCNSEDGKNEGSSLDVLSENKYGGSRDEEFNSSLITVDGGQIVLVRTPSTDGDLSGNIVHSSYDIWIFKLNQERKIEWQKTYGGSDNEDAGKIIQTSDGGYVFCGGTSSTDGDIQGENAGGTRPWIVKISSKGVIEWQSLGTTNDEKAIDVVQTADGGFIYCTFKSLVKIDSIGNTLWTSTIDFYPNSMIQLSNGDLVLSGYKNIPMSNYIDYIGKIEKFNSNGSLLWQNNFDSSFPKKVIEANNDDGFLIIGSTANLNVPNYHSGSGNGNSDVWIAKLNSSGSIEWQKAFGGTLGESASDVIKKGDNYIIGANAGSSNGDLTLNFGYSDYWILEIDSIGTLISQKGFGGSYNDYLGSILKSPNGSFVLTGMSDSSNGTLSSNLFDIWILNVKE